MPSQMPGETGCNHATLPTALWNPLSLYQTYNATAASPQILPSAVQACKSADAVCNLDSLNEALQKGMAMVGGALSLLLSGTHMGALDSDTRS